LGETMSAVAKSRTNNHSV